MATIQPSAALSSEHTAARAEARGAVYAALSVMLAGDAADLDTVREKLLPSLPPDGAGSGSVRHAARQLSETLADGSTADLLRQRRALLPPVESRDLPAYESAYCGSDLFRQAQQMADIAGFYRAHGLAVGASRRERPDHVAVELEFMALLAAKEADALRHLGPEQVEMCRHAQALFVGEHLGRWAPLFAGRLGQRAGTGPIQPVAALLGAWIAAEVAELDVPAGPRTALSESLPGIDGAGDARRSGGEGAP